VSKELVGQKRASSTAEAYDYSSPSSLAFRYRQAASQADIDEHLLARLKLRLIAQNLQAVRVTEGAAAASANVILASFSANACAGAAIAILTDS
jgi:hypothetical protein